MRKIGIFLPSQFGAAVAVTLNDYFLTANSLSPEKHFSTEFYALTPEAVSYTGLQIKAETDIPNDLDIFIIVGTGGKTKEEVIENLIEQSGRIQKVIQKVQKTKALIATTCTAAFFLAHSGLLKGKTATTAWWLLPEMKTLFPKVRWVENQSVVSQGRFLMSGAGFNGVELARVILGKLKKAKLESRVHRILLLHENPVEQKIYAPLTHNPNHPFAEKITSLLEKNWNSMDAERLAQEMNMSSRTFIRRFKEQMKMTPGRWLQLKRIEKAKNILSEQNLSIEEACYQVGYEDQSSFTRLFQREVGLSPSEFRMAFRRK